MNSVPKAMATAAALAFFLGFAGAVHAQAVTPTSAAVALFLGMFTTDLRPSLPKINRPTLIVAAGDDATNPWVARYREMAAAIPGAPMELFADCGHAFFVDDARRFNSLLDQFLNALVK